MTKRISILVSFCLALVPGLLFAGTAGAESRERLENAAEVMQEIMSTPDKAIPQEMLDNAYCIVIVPGLKKGAFIFGAKYGKGYISCRHRNGIGWSAPGTVIVEGGSFGFQIGGEESDVVLLVMNQSGADHLLRSQFTLGAGGAVAAGPVGRTAKAETDAMLSAEILSWSRTHGVFAGISLQGATLREDLEDNKDLYGKTLTNREITQGSVPVPPAAEKLISYLDKISPHREQHP
jgi:lipid-binding SYLF domain-containing protein